MKRTPKAVFFIVLVLILALTYTSFFGVHTHYGDRIDTVITGASEIRFGIDIQGGVDATFGAVDETISVTSDQLDRVRNVIEERMVLQGITDYEIYSDTTSKTVIVRFPWSSSDSDFDPQTAVNELGQTAELSFHYGSATDDDGAPTGDLILTGDDVESATAASGDIDGSGTITPYVQLTLKDSGKKAFAEATATQYAANQAGESDATISIWLDDEMISSPTVSAAITDGTAIISGGFDTLSDAQDLANLINSGALPFSLEVKSFGSVSPTLGEKALEAMVWAGSIAFVLIAVYMLLMYRLPGFVAIFALLGQVAGSLAAVSGYFSIFNGFTLTLPGIAGIIMSMGMGVDANVLTAERIREEIRRGKTIDGSIELGSRSSFSAILDGNITTAIVAAVLMGVFGPSSGIFSKILWVFLNWFPASTTGAVYSFGYTLLVGIIFNFIMSVLASRLMLKSISRFRFLRKPWLLGGERA